MKEKLFLTPQEILEKEFKIDARGYRMKEVDEFLDMVIRDYTEFLQAIKKLEHDKVNLLEDNKKLQAEYRALKTKLETTDENQSNASSSNLDLLKRISKLEKIVYGKE